MEVFSMIHRFKEFCTAFVVSFLVVSSPDLNAGLPYQQGAILRGTFAPESSCAFQSGFMQDFIWDFANGYGSLDQIGSPDLNQGICDTLGNCSLQQANPPESYSFQCDPSMSCSGTNTYDGCPRGVTFERTMIGDIPDGTSQANYPTSGHSVDPVNTFTGELFFYEEPDLALAGSPSVFRFLRYYSSKLVVGGYGDSHIGNNWAHNFGWRLDLRGANAAITTPEGRFIKFEKPASLWTPSQTYEAPFQLIREWARVYIQRSPR